MIPRIAKTVALASVIAGIAVGVGACYYAEPYPAYGYQTYPSYQYYPSYQTYPAYRSPQPYYYRGY